MKIQPITPTVPYGGKRKPKLSDLDKLAKLGAVFAVTGGVMLPPDAKPEVIKEFNKIVADRFKKAGD